MRWLLQAAAILLSLPLRAQSPPSTAEAPNPIPPSPTAASLGKYGNTPINLHSGMVQVNVPLYEIRFNDFSYPISLSHAYNGLKLEEYPSWVGTGWTLNAAGVITRQVRGLPDENPDGYNGANHRGLEAFKFATRQPPYDQTMDYATVLLNNVVDGRWDSEPDMFNFNFGSYSGKFYFDAAQIGLLEKTGTLVPYQGLTIRATFDPFGNNLNGRITQFTVKDQLGVTFLFAEQEESELVEPGDDQVPAYVSSWYLTEITTPNNHHVTFTYEKTGLVEMPPTISENRHIPMATNGIFDAEIDHPDPYRSVKTSMIRETTLRTIVFDFGSVAFLDGPEREDWPYLDAALTRPNVLGAVQINDKYNRELKRYEFTYTQRPRLYLDRVTVRIGTAAEKLYDFEYFDKSGTPVIPSLGFGWEVLYKQDHWGYFNGNDLQTLLPPYDAVLSMPTGESQVIHYPGADRSPNDNSRAGLLQRVTYPTGGYSEFIYEPNDYRLPPNYSYFDLCSAPRQLLNELTASTGQQLWQFTITQSSCMEFRYGLQLRCLNEIWVTVNDLSRNQTVLLKKLSSGNGIPAEEIGTYQVALPAGEYSVAAYSDTEGCPFGVFNQVDIEVNGPSINPDESGLNYIRRGGGYRIALAKDCPGSGPSECVTRKYMYSSLLDSLTSGVITNPPVYTYLKSIYHRLEGQGGLYHMGIVVPYEFQGSQSQVPLGTSGGNYVGYGTVTQLDGSNGENGKVVYKYSTSAEYPDLNKNEFPFPPAESRDYRRGKLTSESVHEMTESGFRLIRQTFNSYLADPAYHLRWDTVGFKFGKVFDAPSYNTDPTSQYVFASYRIPFDWWKLGSSETKDYSYDSAGTLSLLRSAQSFEYDPVHLQPTRAESFDSEGRLIASVSLYPGSSFSLFPPSPTETAGYSALLGKGVEAQKVGDITFVDGRTAQYSRTIFKSFGSVVQPEQVQQGMNGSTPVARLVFHDYDAEGNILRFSKPAGSHTSFLWGGQPRLPIAKAVCSTTSPTIAFTSFEEDATGGWTYTSTDANATRTGKHGLSAGAVSIASLPVATYVVSLWARKSSAATGTISGSVTLTVDHAEWKLYETTHLSPSTITLSLSGVHVDDLRLYPKGCELTTYTYDPLFGMTSATDPNNLTGFYEYDAMGRLKLIRDPKGRILKAYQYRLKNGTP